jgi:hypothetical protein
MDHLQAMNTLAPERYLLGEMTEDERLEFEEHYFSCAECADDVRDGGLMCDGARAGWIGASTSQAFVDSTESPDSRRSLRAVGTPGSTSSASRDASGGRRAKAVQPPRATRRWAPAVVIPWAVAATLAIIAGSQSLVRQRALGGVDRPIALSPATLRPASRGQEPLVPRGPGGVVTLAVDLGGAALDHELEYELRRADNTTVASGRVPAPQAGSPLLLMMPASLLQPSEHYVLNLKNPASADLTASSYRFTVGAP